MTVSSQTSLCHCTDCGGKTEHKIEIGHNETQLRLGYIKLTQEVTTCLRCYKTSGKTLERVIVRNEVNHAEK